MAAPISQTNPPKRGGWKKKLLWLGVICLALLVAAYFVLTSSAFLKSVVLPKVGAALNADLTVADVAVSPFSKAVLRDIKLTPKGAETLFTAKEVRLRYSLMAILGGKIAIEEFTVESPTVTVIENADGTSNLDPLLKAQKDGAKETSKPAAKPGSAPSLDIKSVALKNATVRHTKHLKGGGQEAQELTNVNITLSNLKNGATGKLELAAAVTLDNTAPENLGRLSGKLDGNFGIQLTADAQPASIIGRTRFAVEQATGKMAELAALGAVIECETTPTEIKQLSLRFSKSVAPLGEIRVSGPFDVAKSEGKLKVEILALDRQVLNLAGAASGIDFGTTTINSSNQIELTKGGASIAAAGKLEIARMQVTQQGHTSPTLDVRADYAVTVDQAAQSALLTTLNLTATQNARPLLQSELSSPMTFTWGKTAATAGDAALNITLTALNLNDWQAFTGYTNGGVVTAKIKMLSQAGGKNLTVDLDGRVTELGLAVGGNKLAAATLKGTTSMQLGAGDEIAAKSDLKLTADFSQSAPTLDLQADFSVVANSAAQSAVVKTLNLTGTQNARPLLQSELSAPLTFAWGKTTSAAGDAALTISLTALKFADWQAFTGFTNSGVANAKIKLRSQAGGKNLTCDLDGRVSELALALGENKLDAVTVKGATSVQLGAGDEMAAQTDLKVSADFSQPKTTLDARWELDTTVAKQVAQLRQCRLTLTPTSRAKNELGLTGKVDASKTNAITGGLKLAAESLDLTSYYDLFGGQTKPVAGTASTPPPAPAKPAADPNQEPEAIKLPFRDFTFEVKIGRLYLREVDIANWQTTTRLDGGKVLVKPCALTLNGAPVSAGADLDLSVPGYRYDVNFSAQAVPLPPLVNSFQPERKGQIGGQTTASAQIKGAGITGASLEKNLAGQYSLLATNLNLSVGNVRTPAIKSILNVIIAIPDLIRDPTAAVGNLLSRLTGTGTSPASKGGWTDDITAAPVDVILARGSVGSGRVTLEQAEVRSTAFQALAKGEIALNPILTNSTMQIPVNVALSRALATQAGLVTASTPTNLAYVAFPEFLQMKGTVGKPKPEVDKAVLTAFALKAGAGIANKIGGASGEKVGTVLQGLGGLLGGSTPATATTTNAPNATNANPAADLLNLFKKPKK